MSWISRTGALTQEEMENNANIVINTYRSMGYDDNTIAGILGNMQNESSINPERVEEGGGGGYGLVQWTPQSVLINHCQTLALTPYNDGDVQLEVIDAELQKVTEVNEWYTTHAFIEPYKASGATDDMVNITGEQFKKNEMKWKPDKLAIMFMVGYERPNYDPNINHIEKRKSDSLAWYKYMGGVIPPKPPTRKDGKALINLWICKALTGGI